MKILTDFPALSGSFARRRSFGRLTLFRLAVALVLFSLFSCRPNRWLTGYIPDQSLPDDYAGTVLLVSAFDYTPLTENNRNERKLIRYTNRHLSALDGKLVRVWDRYKYPHKIVKFSQIDSLYPDTGQYRYIVCRKVVYRFTNTGNGPSYYTYQYYLFDRQRRLIQPDIGIYSSFLWKTTRVLIHKLNKKAPEAAAARKDKILEKR